MTDDDRETIGIPETRGTWADALLPILIGLAITLTAIAITHG